MVKINPMKEEAALDVGVQLLFYVCKQHPPIGVVYRGRVHTFNHAVGFYQHLK